VAQLPVPAILDAALAEFAEHGPNGASLRDIARRAGVPLADVVAAGTKGELFDLVMMTETGRHLAAVAFDPTDPAGYIEAFATVLEEQPLLARLLLWHQLERSSGSSAGVTLQAIVDDRVDQLRQAQSDGHLSPALEPEVIAVFTYALPMTAAVLPPQMAASLGGQRWSSVLAASMRRLLEA